MARPPIPNLRGTDLYRSKSNLVVYRFSVYDPRSYERERTELINNHFDVCTVLTNNSPLASMQEIQRRHYQNSPWSSPSDSRRHSHEPSNQFYSRSHLEVKAHCFCPRTYKTFQRRDEHQEY